MSATRAPRVLVLGTLLGQPMGGVRRHNAELLPRAAEILEDRGGTLAVMEGREPIAFPLPPRIRIIRTGAVAHPVLARFATEGRAVRRALAGFDLVHTGHLPAPYLSSTPFTITVHDLRHLEPGHSSELRRSAAAALLSRAIGRAARVITVSETVRAAILERFRIETERVLVVPNAADHFAPLPRSVAHDAPILHVGHLEPRKNLELLLRALALDRGLPRLELAGAGKGAEEERLRTLARELGVEARVRFLGPVDDAELPALYAGAACVVLPSTIEGFGIPAIEAQRAGAPLAIARTPTLVEVAGPQAPSFSPEDPAECAGAIRKAIAGPSASGNAGRFSWDASARLLVEAWTAASS
ncbi:MAG: glycosyltransferase family 4 protein [Planctomycetota bacterium]